MKTTLSLIIAGLSFSVLASSAVELPELEEFVGVVGSPAGVPLEDEKADEEVSRISSLIRCPVCQGLSLEDSPSPMAGQMRDVVDEMVRSGFTEDQILRYFEASYGEFVLLEPRARGINLLVWVAPLLALVIGGGLILWRRFSSQSEAPDNGSTRQPDDDPYLVRARALGEGEVDA